MVPRAFLLVAAAVAVAAAVFSCDGSGGSGGQVSGGDGDGDSTDNVVYVDSIDMVYVDGGTFMMGCDPAVSGSACNTDAPSHEVSLGGFYIGKYEVTQKLWNGVMGENPACYGNEAFGDSPEQPVENVSWNDAQGFIAKLNKATGKSYRLPTEAEWEYAARGGANGGNFEFSGGDDIDEVAWYKGNSGSKTQPVGGKLPNALGLYDMSGNVGEWVADWYGENYYSVSPRDNPEGPSSSAQGRVYRGGTWSYNPVACRIFRRDMEAPDKRECYLGFRLAHP